MPTCMRSSRVSLSPVLALLLLTPLRSSAQDAASGMIVGRVTDPSDAVVESAVVRATRDGSRTREAVTSRQGTYVLSGLAPAVYEVTIEARGFRKQTFSAVPVYVGSRTVIDAFLDVSGHDEVIEVEGRSRFASASSSVGGVITSAEIDSLPLNGRNFLELAFLVPGNAPAPHFDPTKTNSVIVSSAGQAGRGGNITIDGQDNNDDVVGGPLANLPQDAVQEFQITTNRFSAEQGRSGGSAINVVTKSGTDARRGSLSLFLRDDALQSAPPIQDADGADIPFSREQYSASLGGPIVSGRAWWFGALEVRNQDAVVQVGERDGERREIRRTLAAAPLDDILATGRVDIQASPRDSLTLRHVFEDAEDTGTSALDRALGSATQRQASRNVYHVGAANWTRVFSSRAVGTLRTSYSDYQNEIVPVTPGRQLTFPSFQDGASFRVPQATSQRRFQVSPSLGWVRGDHALKVGAEVSRTTGDFVLGVFREGRVELVQDFPQFDLDRDGRVTDEDLLFAVTLRSGKPNEDLSLKDCSSTHLSTFVQDDWRVSPQLTLNVGMRWEMDTDVKNISGYGDVNPIVKPFLQGDRRRDLDNFGPRVGFTWTGRGGALQVHGGYGIYYDRITLEIISLERGLDGRALPIEVRAGNVMFLDPATGTLPPGAPTFSNPFTGFILPGAGASGINIIDNAMENPTVQQFNVGAQVRLPGSSLLSVDLVHNRGSHFIIGRAVGEVVNPVVGGPDRVVNLESSVGTRYSGVLATLEKSWPRGSARAAYTLSRARNYANDDQIPFGSGPIDPNDLAREYGPTPNEQRHRLVLSGSYTLPGAVRIAPLWTIASGVPMDILMPDGARRVPTLARNSGGRRFKTGAQLNEYVGALNALGGVGGVLLPLVSDDARFTDGFSSLDLRVSRAFALSTRARVELIVEGFNVLDTTNILGVTKANYSGFANALVRDSDDPTSAGYRRSSSFGRPVTTAGGVFGSGGPRAFQIGARFVF